MNKPFISVITIVWNAKEGLIRSVQSVQQQKGVSYEHLVIDGNSRDGSVEWLRQNSDPNLVWISEPDKGIYDAMNKGIDRAQGEWIYFLSGGDQVLPGAFEQIAPLLTPELDLVAGHVRQTDGGTFESTFSEEIYLGNIVHHQGAFYNRRLFDTFRYNTKLRAMSDYELNLLLRIQRKNVRIINVFVGMVDVGGISQNYVRSLVETHKLRARHIGQFQSTRYSFKLGWRYLLINLRKIKRKLKAAGIVKR